MPGLDKCRKNTTTTTHPSSTLHLSWQKTGETQAFSSKLSGNSIPQAISVRNQSEMSISWAAAVFIKIMMNPSQITETLRKFSFEKIKSGPI